MSQFYINKQSMTNTSYYLNYNLQMISENVQKLQRFTILIPQSLPLLCKFLKYLDTTRFLVNIYKEPASLRSFTLTYKEPVFIIVTNSSLISRQPASRNSYMLVNENSQPNNMNIPALILISNSQKQALKLIVNGVKLKETSVVLDKSLQKEIFQKIQDICNNMGITYKIGLNNISKRSSEDIIMITGLYSKVQGQCRVLVLKRAQNVEEQFLKVFFSDQISRVKFRIFYQRNNPTLQKHLLMMITKCKVIETIMIQPFSSIYQLKTSFPFPNITNNMMIAHSNILFQALRIQNSILGKRYLFSVEKKSHNTIDVEGINEEISKHLSLSEIISSELQFQKISLSKVIIMDGYGSQQIKQICQNINIQYFGISQKNIWLNLQKTKRISNREELDIVIIKENTFTVAELQEIKNYVDSGSVLIILIKNTLIPLPSSISKYISHTCEQTALKHYIITLLSKYTFKQQTLTPQETVLIHKAQKNKPLQPEVNQNQTSIQYYLTLLNSLEQQNKIIFQHGSILEEKNSKNVYIFHQYQDLLKLYQRFKGNGIQIRTIMGTWYDNMLGCFNASIVRYPAKNSNIKVPNIDLSKYNQVHFFYQQNLQTQILEHILHVCKCHQNYIPHKIQSFLQIKYSVSNHSDYTFAFTCSSTLVNQIQVYQSTNCLICSSLVQMHSILFSICGQEYPHFANVKIELINLEYFRILRSASGQFNSDPLSSSSMNISKSSQNERDIIQLLNEIRVQGVLHVKIPQLLFKQFSEEMFHIKNLHIQQYQPNLFTKLKTNKNNFRCLVFLNDSLEQMEKIMQKYPENIYCSEDGIFKKVISFQKLPKCIPHFVVRNRKKFISLLNLSTKRYSKQQSFNISNSSHTVRPVVLFYKYPQQYSLKQQISTHCSRPIDLRAYSNIQSLLVNIKSIESQLASVQQSLIIVVLKDQDINNIEPELEHRHRVIRLFTPTYIMFGKIPTNDITLFETTNYSSIINYLKQNLQQDIQKTKFGQQKTIKIGLDLSQSSESIITLGRHSLPKIGD